MCDYGNICMEMCLSRLVTNIYPWICVYIVFFVTCVNESMRICCHVYDVLFILHIYVNIYVLTWFINV